MVATLQQRYQTEAIRKINAFDKQYGTRLGKDRDLEHLLAAMSAAANRGDRVSPDANVDELEQAFWGFKIELGLA